MIKDKTRIGQSHLDTYKDVEDRFEKLEVVEVDNVAVDPIGIKVVSDGVRAPKERVVKDLQELGRVSLFGPIFD